MKSGTLDAIVRRILLVADQPADQSDVHLVECFVTRKDEAAFATLMERHGRLVFGVCRSVLDQEQDAEDAFQATFLVLARMASSIRKGNSLASWLHGVALRTALKARHAMNTRRRKERHARTQAPEQPVSDAAFRELQAILHEEVGRLAEKYRTPFVLCCLEGKSRTEASTELGWKEGTVASRVAQARKLLESRLLSRGVALPAALAAVTLAPIAVSAAGPIARAAVAFAAGNVPEAVSAWAVTLAEGVIQAMFVTKLKMITGVVLVLALLLSGGGLLGYAALQSQERDPATVAPPPKGPDEIPADANRAAQDKKPAATYMEVDLGGGIKMKLVRIEAGKFVMGASSKSERDDIRKWSDERLKPIDQEEPRAVEITKPFYMGVYVVTQSEYEKVMGKNPSYFKRDGGGKKEVDGLDTARFPVEFVSWEDAKEFCRKLSQKEGKTFELPTEAEWEYASRAGTKGPFHFGASLSSKQANFNGDHPYGGAAKGPWLNRTTPVGSYEPNAFGLYDMHGNVRQYCEDVVVRGGCWYDHAWYCRSAARIAALRDDRNYLQGFRVVLRTLPAADSDAPPGDSSSLETALPTGAIDRFGTTRYRTGTMVGSMKLSPDGKKLVSGGRGSGGGVFVWDAATGKRLLWRPLGEEGEISRDGERLFLIETLPAEAKAKAKPAADKLDLPVEVLVSPLVADFKNALKIYQISSGKLLKQIDGSGHLYRVAISPDERTLALEYNIPNVNSDPAGHSANWFVKTVELYDLKAGRVTHKLGELPQNYAGNGLVRFSADGKSLFAVTGSKENENRNESTVRRFDVATGALKSKTTIKGMGYQMPRGYHTPLNAADKTLILSGTTLWDLDKERQHWALKGNDLQAIYAFMADGRSAIAWTVKEKWLDAKNPSTPCKLVHWDLENDREIRRLPGISFGGVSPDGKTCYGSNHPYNRWFRYDIEGAKEIDTVDALTAPAEQLAVSPDGKYVATLGLVWERATGKRVHQFEHGSRVLFFTPDNAALVLGVTHLPKQRPSGGQAHGLRILDMATWKESTREFEDLEAGTNIYYCGMCLSPDGKVLAGPYHLWDFASGKVICKLKHDDMQARMSMFAFSPDSKKLAYFAPANRLEVLNIAEKKVVSDWPIGNHRDRNLSFVKGGELVATSYSPPRPPWRGTLRFPEYQDKPIPADWPATMPPMPDAVIRVWDPATGKEKYRVQYPQSEYDGTELPPLFSPDGKLMATASLHDEAVLFRDSATGKEVGRFRSGVKGIHTMAFSPDSRLLAVSAKDTTVLLVDVRKVMGKP